jgi:signal transduction histidine kinase
MSPSPSIAAGWFDTLRERPVASVAAAVALVVLAALGGGALRVLTRRTRSLRRLVLAITLASIALGAVAALVLGRLMVLDSAAARSALGVLAATAVCAIVLTVVASSPLGRDAQRLEAAVRRLESGDRSGRTGVARADELGHVARALDELGSQLHRLESERSATERERRLMFTSVGHDLRTPLTALRAAIEALADGIAPDPDRYISSMARDVEALGALIDDLFLLATIESGRLDLDLRPVDLAELADEAVEALQPTAGSRRVRVRVHAAGAVRVDGDAKAIGRVIRNLVDNAIRHAPVDSDVGVFVDDRPGPSVRVVDGGPGFPPEFRERVFEPFARPDSSRTRATGGAGLGLVIARGLVEAHGGRMWIERVAPETDSSGARVAFTIPVT